MDRGKKEYNKKLQVESLPYTSINEKIYITFN